MVETVTHAHTPNGAGLLKSFGALQTVFDYTEPLEATKFQALSKWLYNTAVSRAQVKV